MGRKLQLLLTQFFMSLPLKLSYVCMCDINLHVCWWSVLAPENFFVVREQPTKERKRGLVMKKVSMSMKKSPAWGCETRKQKWKCGFSNRFFQRTFVVYECLVPNCIKRGCLEGKTMQKETEVSCTLHIKKYFLFDFDSIKRISFKKFSELFFSLFDWFINHTAPSRSLLHASCWFL